MADINLLKQTATTRKSSNILPAFGKLLILCVLAMAGYYVWMVLSLQNVEKNTQATAQELSSAKEALLGSKERKELLVRQSQLSQLNSLIDKHVYWSDILPELAKVVLKDSQLLGFEASNDGTIKMSVKVLGMAELDKFLQVFDQPQFNKNFYNVRITSLSNTEDKGTGSIYTKFDLQMNYNPSLLKYNNIANQ